MTVTVRPFTAADEAAFRERWDKYNVFYKRTIPEDVTAFTIKRMLDPAVPLYGAVAVDDQQGMVGFVTYLPHIYTGSVEDIVYLHDLYVDDEVRNGGIGRKLIEHVYEDARELGCESVYWHTQHFNHRAQLLYTKVADKTDFVQYKHVL
jgi:D-amino-acid N-acetyltransferase